MIIYLIIYLLYLLFKFYYTIITKFITKLFIFISHSFSLFSPVSLSRNPLSRFFLPPSDLPSPVTSPTGDDTSTERRAPAFPLDQPIASKLAGIVWNEARRGATQRLSCLFPAKQLRCRPSSVQTQLVGVPNCPDPLLPTRDTTPAKSSLRLDCSYFVRHHHSTADPPITWDDLYGPGMSWI